ncbi:MAG: SoxR reducing system RseC family protein [Deltaproteobacteria bacterium]|nr:SoxR reducing system RseC family protein [Deltaproteobacteria bacterium]
MIEEHGIVVRNKGGTVLIKTQRSSSCEGCASKKTCSSGQGSNGDMFIEADNIAGADVGDRVVFSAGTGSILKAGALLYLVPILCFIFGVVIGQTSFVTGLFPGQNPDLLSGVLGAVFLALAFIGLKVYSAFLDKSKTFRPKVLRVE